MIAALESTAAEGLQRLLSLPPGERGSLLAAVHADLEALRDVLSLLCGADPEDEDEDEGADFYAD